MEALLLLEQHDPATTAAQKVVVLFNQLLNASVGVHGANLTFRTVGADTM